MEKYRDYGLEPMITDKMEKFFKKLRDKNKTIFSLSQLVNEIKISEVLGHFVLKAYISVGILKPKFYLVCPKCKKIIREFSMEELSEFLPKGTSEYYTCYRCDTPIDKYDPNNIFIAYTFV